MADPIHTCDACGRQYAARRKRKNCTRQCAKATYRGKVWAGPRWPDGVPESHKTYTCRVCGADFKPKRAGRTTTCSQECGRFWAGRKAMLAKTGGRVSHVVTMSHCDVCGDLYVKRWGALTCSTQCTKQRARRSARDYAQRKDTLDRPPRDCAECGVSFEPKYGDQRRVYCSERCSLRAHRRVAKKAERARLRSAKVESVNPTKVFERDGWKCQMCGVRTPRKLRGTYDPRAPELDHIVPLSRGGAHSYRNTQCACRQCNHTKGNEHKGQLRLFGGVAP